MTVVKINAIHVPDTMGPHLETRFAQRAHLVDGTPGFEGFELLRPVAGDDRYFMISILFNIKQVAAWALQADEYLALDIPPVQSLYILAGWCVLCLMIIRRRVRPVHAWPAKQRSKLPIPGGVLEGNVAPR